MAENTTPPGSPGSLSQTKLADLPGFVPGDVQAIELQVGQVLSGRYEIQALIGQGGMGAVYQAHDSNTDRAIALKVLLPSLFKNERAKARFLSEAKISQQLSHPHIVNVYDVQQDGELFFLTMELLEGQDLRGWLDNLKAVGQQPAIDEVKRITGELCEALAYAHEYTIHRDIKPENIWLDEKGRVKLMDFGIAQVQSASQRTQTGAAMGTAYYMAPEQLQGRELKAQADIYAVGVLLYEMLTGQIPTGRFESALKLRPSVGKKLSAVIDQCLEVASEKRFVSAKALKEALLEGKGIRTSRAGAADSGSGKNYGLAAGIVLAVLVLGGLGYSGQLNGVFEALKPLDRDLLAQQQADATRLLGEIRNLDSRLDNSLQDLERDVSEAQRNSAANLGHLEEWEQLARRHISESSELTRLEGELALGETLLRDETRSAEALASLQLVREGYQGLLDKFNAIDRLLTEEVRTASALEQWQSYRRGYDFADPPALSNIDTLGNDAARQKREGLIDDALKSQEEMQASYLLAQEEVAGDITRIDGERVARRQAADAAERERLAEVERQRLATEALRKSELAAEQEEFKNLIASTAQQKAVFLADMENGDRAGEDGSDGNGGENGRNGRNGSPGASSTSQASGQNGESGGQGAQGGQGGSGKNGHILNVKISEIESKYLSIAKISVEDKTTGKSYEFWHDPDSKLVSYSGGSDGGQGGRGGFGGRGGLGGVGYLVGNSSRAGSDGRHGSGGAGGAGGDGGAGGEGATVRIELKGSKAFEQKIKENITFIVAPHIGGSGGAGGAGGAGGQGDGDDFDFSSRVRGRDGSDGPTGSKGRDGNRGTVEFYSI